MCCGSCKGLQRAVYDGESDAEHNTVHKKFKEFELAKPGTLSPQEYDQFVRDTVNFSTTSANRCSSNGAIWACACWHS